MEAAPVEILELKVDVSVGTRRASERDSSYVIREGQEITCKVKIENRTRDIDLAESKFTVILVGRNLLRYVNRANGNAKIFAKEDFQSGIAAGRSVEFTCKPFMTGYDSDRDESNVGGYEYDGYVMMMQDDEGKIVETYSNLGDFKVKTMKDPALVKKVLGIVGWRSGAAHSLRRAQR